MARRTWSQLVELYPDNTAGAISAADLRDGVIDSARPHTAPADPTAANDATQGFDVGHEWLNTTTGDWFKCRDASVGAAVWEPAGGEGTQGPPGEQGEQGPPGEKGDPGVGVPAGGAAGQVLAKASNTDYDTEWVTGGGGGGGIAPADGLVVVQHGAVASTARPTAAVALWRGSAEPENAVDGDMWDDDDSWDA